MQDAQSEKRDKENLTIIRDKFLGLLKKKFTLENSSPYSSPRNRAKVSYRIEQGFTALCKLTYIDFTSLELEQTSDKKKTRIDNFGQEIKKGGKHKIVFADELERNKLKDKNKRRNSFPKLKEKNGKKEKKNERKRNNSAGVGKRNLIKKFYNIYNLNNGKAKLDKFKNVDIIDFQSTKKENKLNTYSLKKNIVVSDEDNVCCSCYCLIF